MKILLMTTPNFFIEEHQIVTALFDEGLESLHLRKPGSQPVFSERLLSLIPETYRRRIVVHDHFYLKDEFNLKGIHLSPRNPQPPDGYKGHVSCSCYRPEDIRGLKRNMDYVLFSIRQTPEDSLPIGMIRELVDEGTIDKKVYLQGFVSDEDIPVLRHAGVEGVVVQNAIWNDFSIYSTQDFKDIIKHLRRLRKLAD
ncbi:MAG: thiamine phosphate synthase [Alloprevotella sp.]|nr:thiamine phosphate synthase [Alloprevotella sp.]MBR6376093.1 thiamine phosphate synthase [Alloprevotella sp.]